MSGGFVQVRCSGCGEVLVRHTGRRALEIIVLPGCKACGAPWELIADLCRDDDDDDDQEAGER